MGRGRRARLEHDRRRRRGARPGRRRDARARLPAAPPGPRRRLRALAGTGLGRAVDGLGDPGVPRRRPEGAGRRPRVPRAAEARRTAATATRPRTRRRRSGSRRRCCRRSPEGRCRCGPADHGSATQPGSGRTSRPSSTSRATSAGHENHRPASRSGATTAARTPAITSSSSPPPVAGSGRTWSQRRSSLVMLVRLDHDAARDDGADALEPLARPPAELELLGQRGPDLRQPLDRLLRLRPEVRLPPPWPAPRGRADRPRRRGRRSERALCPGAASCARSVRRARTPTGTSSSARARSRSSRACTAPRDRRRTGSAGSSPASASAGRGRGGTPPPRPGSRARDRA